MDEWSADRSGRCAGERVDPGSSSSPCSKVMVVAGHRTTRLALRHALESHGVAEVADAPLGREAVVAAMRTHPRVVLVDLASDPASGVDTCRQFHQARITTRVAALAPRVGPPAHAARAAGVCGVITTDCSLDELVRFLMTMAGRSGPSRPPAPARILTDREQEVLALVAVGLTDGQVSRSLYISAKTVKNHLHHVYTKLGARSRTEAVTLGLRQGLISL